MRVRARRTKLRAEPLEQRTLLAVNALANFAGMDFDDSGGSVPPDPIAAAGPAHVVEMVNTTIAFYDKTTGDNLFQQPLEDFFADVGAGENLFDPVVAYDEIAGRFFVGVLERDDEMQNSFFHFGISDTADPLDGFSGIYKIDVREMSQGDFTWADFPRVGWNADAYVFTFNTFFFGGSYDHLQVLSIDKASVLDDGDDDLLPLTYYQADRDASHSTMAPATMHGSLPGDSMWFVEEAGEANGHSLRVVEMTGVLTTVPTFSDSDIEVPTYAVPRPAKQPGRRKIDTGDTGLLNAAWRDGRLVACHTVAGTGRATARVRWYEFDTTAATPTLTQSGEINPGKKVNTYFPSVEIAANGDLGMTFMQSWSREFMSMYVTGRTLADPLGVMQTPVLAKAGEAKYRAFDGAPYRAGDFSGITVDPVGETSFWAANEYATAAIEDNWGTWIANFSISAAAVLSANVVRGSNSVAILPVEPAVVAAESVFRASPAEAASFRAGSADTEQIRSARVAMPAADGVSVARQSSSGSAARQSLATSVRTDAYRSVPDYRLVDAALGSSLLYDLWPRSGGLSDTEASR